MEERTPSVSTSVFTARLLNRRLLTISARTLTVEQLDKVIGILEDVKEQVIAEEQAAREAKAAREEKLKTLYDLAVEQGVSPEDMAEYFGAFAESSKQRISVKKAPMYRLTDADGTHEWTGKGPTPKWLKAFEAQDGRTRADCLIDAEGMTNWEREQAHQQG